MQRDTPLQRSQATPGPAGTQRERFRVQCRHVPPARSRVVSGCAGTVAAVDAGPPPTAAVADGFDVARRVLGWVIVLALVGTVLALLLVGRVVTTYRDGLEVARDGADVGAVSAASANLLAGDLLALIDSTGSSLDRAADLLETASTTTAGVGAALGTNLAAAVEGTAGIANGMAGLVEAIERLIPGDSDSLAEDLRDIADGLGPVPEQLRSLGEQLATASTELSDAVGLLVTAAEQLDDLTVSVVQARAALAEVEDVAGDVRGRAVDALDRSGTDAWLVRLLVLVLGVGTVAVCLAGRHAIAALRTAPVGR
jgi:hypothetical protein